MTKKNRMEEEREWMEKWNEAVMVGRFESEGKSHRGGRERKGGCRWR